MTYTQYTTVAGDRWDLLAFAAYGDANRFPEIMAVNPAIPARDEIQAGTVVILPVQEVQTNSTVSPSLMPPWKR